MIVKGPTDQMTTNFRMEDKGPVISIKFSPDQQVLAIQRTKTSVVIFFSSYASWDSEQGCGLDCRGVVVRILAGGREFCFFHTLKTSSGIH